MPYPPGTHVTYGADRGRFGKIQRSERRHGRDGYFVIPLSVTRGDGHGPKWYAEDQVTTEGVDRWSYDLRRNTYVKR